MARIVNALLFRNKNHSAKDVALEVFEELTFRSRRVITLSLTALASVIFFCGGIFIAVLSATSQYDRSGTILWTSTFGSGVTLIVLASIAFAVVFLRAWPGVHEAAPRMRSKNARPAAGLDEALSALVMDFVDSRRQRRQTKATSRAEARASRREERRRPEEDIDHAHIH